MKGTRVFRTASVAHVGVLVAGSALLSLGCGGEPLMPRAADGRPLSVPLDYVPIAKWYVAPSCIVRASEPGDVVIDHGLDGIEIKGMNGQSRIFGACQLPRYRANGELVPPPRVTAPATTSASSDGITSTRSALVASYAYFRAGPIKQIQSTWHVPTGLPTSPVEVMLWVGGEPADSSYVLQPIVDSLAGNNWRLTNCYDAPSGVFTCGALMTVNAGDLITGTIYGNSTAWVVSSTDSTTGQSPPVLPVSLAGTSGLPTTVVAAGMEVFSVTNCNQLPPAQSVNFATQWQDPNNAWHVWFYNDVDPSISPNCHYNASTNVRDASVTLSWTNVAK